MNNVDYLYNPEAAKPLLARNFFVDKKLGFQVIENGTILPYKKTINGMRTRDGWGYGGIVDSTGEYIRTSHVESGIGSSYPPPPDKIQKSSETVIYLGMFHSTWGHCITDNIRRLWFLKSEYFKEFKDCPLVYLICTKMKEFTLETYENFRRLLEILEVDVESLRLVTEPTVFEKIILPDESFSLGRTFTNEYRETINQIRDFALKNKTTLPVKKVYYFHGARHIGEEHLAEYFHSKGYEVVSPEKLTLDEQLNLLINCENFAATIGSTSHNSVFLREGTEATFIPRLPGSIGSYQASLNQVNSIKANYVDSTLGLFGNWYVHNLYIISPLLKNFFGDKRADYEEEDFKIFLSYVKDSMEKNRLLDPRTDEYYGKILPDFMAQLKQREDLITVADMPPHWEDFRQKLIYQTHIHKKSWVTWGVENSINGYPDEKFDIQAIKINYPNHKVYYSVYYDDKEGWSEEVTNSEVAGTTGKGKAIYGVRIRLDEASSKEFNILYRVHKFDDTWTAWVKNGECIYSYGQKLNAIQIKLEAKP